MKLAFQIVHTEKGSCLGIILVDSFLSFTWPLKKNAHLQFKASNLYLYHKCLWPRAYFNNGTGIDLL